jgi:hypothetical protein
MAFRSCRSRLLPLRGDALSNLFSVNGNRTRRLDAHAYLVAFDAQYDDGNISTDRDDFTHSSGQDENDVLPLAIGAVWYSGSGKCSPLCPWLNVQEA